MLESYFFIPSNSPNKLAKSSLISADQIIFDMEDTIGLNEINQCLSNLELVPNRFLGFIRPKLVVNDKLYVNLITKLIDLGYSKFVIPKLHNLEMWLELIDKIDCTKLELIILVEHPLFLLDLTELLKHSGKLISMIGYGAHDYCTYSGLKYTRDNVNRVRFEVSWRANAFDIPCIDTASMNISDKMDFETECLDAFELGCSAKFLIHPWQMKILNEVSFFSEQELDWAKKAIQVLKTIPSGQLSAVVVDGKILEQPHLKKVEQIKKYLASHDS